MTMRRAVRPAPGRRTTCSRAVVGGVLAVAVAIGSAATLASCAPSAPSALSASADPAPSVAATTEPPAPDGPAPDGTAEDNLPYFSEIVRAVWASEKREEGRAYVDALVEGGFDRDAMQVTEDLTTVGNPVESMQFSVRWDDECLIGQVGPDIGEAVTRVLPALEDGTVCLLGDTRPIDW